MLKVGIAGYGIVGQRRREYIDQNALFRTEVVCDQKFGHEGTMEDGVPYCTDYRRMLEFDLDVLFVCLTNDLAAECTIAGLNKNLHVFCEKPPGKNLEDLRRVQDVYKNKNGLKLKYGFNHRYHDSVKDALQIVDSGTLGNVINLRGIYGKSKIINFRSDWRTKREIAGGGILLDQGIHMVDLIRLFAGEFNEVHSFVSNGYWNHDVEDNVYAIMRTETGRVAMLHSSATQWQHRFSLEISLEEGAIVLSGFLTGSKSYGDETLSVIEKISEDSDPKETTTRYHADPSWRSEVDEFSKAIDQDLEIVNGSIEDSCRTMQLVYDIYCADTRWRDQWQLSNTPIVDQS